MKSGFDQKGFHFQVVYFFHTMFGPQHSHTGLELHDDRIVIFG